MINLKIGFFKNQTSPRLRFTAVELKKPIICSHSAGGEGVKKGCMKYTTR